MTTVGTPEKWARFLEENAPGLTWLAATLLEWGELPPFARRSWRVTVQTSRAGDVEGLGALHEETGLCVIAARAGLQAPFLGDADKVRRLLGAPESLDPVFKDQPMLLIRRLPGFRRQVFTYDGEAPARHPALQRASANAAEELEEFRKAADGNMDAVTPPELAGPVQRGLVWVLKGDSGPRAMFRIEGIARRRVQITDACVHPDFRGEGLGAAVLRSAASVARTEYARGAALAVPVGEGADATARRAEFTPAGFLDDVRLS